MWYNVYSSLSVPHWSCLRRSDLGFPFYNFINKFRNPKTIHVCRYNKYTCIYTIPFWLIKSLIHIIDSCMFKLYVCMVCRMEEQQMDWVLWMIHVCTLMKEKRKAKKKIEGNWDLEKGSLWVSLKATDVIVVIPVKRLKKKNENQRKRKGENRKTTAIWTTTFRRFHM